jgi:hypothetical protein
MMYEKLLAEQVAEYIAKVKPKADEEHHYYQSKPSLEEAIRCATYAIKANGKRHTHQRWIKSEVMEYVRQRLLGRQQDLPICHDFEKLHTIVSECAVSGFAILCIYDTAIRLGAYLRIKPEYVYLHHGTRTGAITLGFDRSRKFIGIKELPEELQRMSADDIENFLCIYKDELRTGKPTSKSKCLSGKKRSAC